MKHLEMADSHVLAFLRSAFQGRQSATRNKRHPCDPRCFPQRGSKPPPSQTRRMGLAELLFSVGVRNSWGRCPSLFQSHSSGTGHGHQLKNLMDTVLTTHWVQWSHLRGQFELQSCGGARSLAGTGPTRLNATCLNTWFVHVGSFDASRRLANLEHVLTLQSDNW